MAQHQAGIGRSTGDSRSSASTVTRVSPWVTGFSAFAGIMLIVIGASHFLAGLSAVLNDTFYVVGANYTMKFDVTTWGWIQMAAGAIAALAGIGILSGRSLAARIVGIIVAGASIVWSFYSIPYYPVWSILIIALDVVVIWALAAHGGESEAATD